MQLLMRMEKGKTCAAPRDRHQSGLMVDFTYTVGKKGHEAFA